MSRTAPLLIAVGLTMVGAVVQGSYQGRWGAPVDLVAAGLTVERLPARIGQWRHVSDESPLSPFVRKELGLIGHINRVYEHDGNGRVVQVLLMAGRPGPLVRHPPSVCYANRAHQLIGAKRRIQIDAGARSSEFQLLTYRPARSQGAERFFVCYGLTAGESWDAPTWPRVRYGGHAALYKVQVLLNLADENSESNAIEDLRGFLAGLTDEFGRMPQGRPVIN